MMMGAGGGGGGAQPPWASAAPADLQPQRLIGSTVGLLWLCAQAGEVGNRRAGGSAETGAELAERAELRETKP